MKPLYKSFKRGAPVKRVLLIWFGLTALTSVAIAEACSLDRLVSREQLNEGLIAAALAAASGCDKKQEGVTREMLCTKDRQESATLYNTYMQFCDKEAERNARRLDQQRLDSLERQLELQQEQQNILGGILGLQLLEQSRRSDR